MVVVPMPVDDVSGKPGLGLRGRFGLVADRDTDGQIIGSRNSCLPRIVDLMTTREITAAGCEEQTPVGTIGGGCVSGPARMLWTIFIKASSRRPCLLWAGAAFQLRRRVRSGVGRHAGKRVAAARRGLFS
jgi:hypothetical protein